MNIPLRLSELSAPLLLAKVTCPNIYELQVAENLIQERIVFTSPAFKEI